VELVADANPSRRERVGSVSLGRKTVTVTQSGGGEPPEILSVTPDLIVGATTDLDVLVAERNGISDLESVAIRISAVDASAAEICSINLTNVGGVITLRSSGATADAPIDSNELIESGDCSVDLARSSVERSEDRLRLKLALGVRPTGVGLGNVATSARDRDGLESAINATNWQFSAGSSGPPSAATIRFPTVTGTGVECERFVRPRNKGQVAVRCKRLAFTTV